MSKSWKEEDLFTSIEIGDNIILDEKAVSSVGGEKKYKKQYIHV